MRDYSSAKPSGWNGDSVSTTISPAFNIKMTRFVEGILLDVYGALVGVENVNLVSEGRTARLMANGCDMLANVFRDNRGLYTKIMFYGPTKEKAKEYVWARLGPMLAGEAGPV